MIDPDILDEALQGAATIGRRYSSASISGNTTAGAKAVRSLRYKISRFLEDLPGDATVEDLRDGLGSPQALEVDDE